MRPDPPFPWVFLYIEEPVAQNYPRPDSGTPVALRPAAKVRLASAQDESDIVYGLVDSGAEHTYGAPWLPLAIAVTPDPATETTIAIAGRPRLVRFADVKLRLLAPLDEAVFYEWRTPVGFFTEWEPPWVMILGQRGFFDEFTVSLRRPVFAVEPKEVFDTRFP